MSTRRFRVTVILLLALATLGAKGCGGGSAQSKSNASNLAACAALTNFNSYYLKAISKYDGQSLVQESAADLPHIRALETAVRGAGNTTIRRLGLEIAVSWLYSYGQRPNGSDGHVKLLANLSGVTSGFQSACRQVGYSESAAPSAPTTTQAEPASTLPRETTAPTSSAATPVSVPLMSAPMNVSCPTLDGSSPHYTHFSSPPPMCINPDKDYTAQVVTDAGTITVKLLAAQNPTTVNNFVFLAGYHFYDGTAFHRVCTGFINQGGDPTGTGMGGPGHSFNGGAPTSSSVYTGGALAMANSGSPSSDGSQFFFVVGSGGKDLSASYSYFGKVVGGMNVVNKINAGGSSAATTNDICPPKVVHKVIEITIIES